MISPLLEVFSSPFPFILLLPLDTLLTQFCLPSRLLVVFTPPPLSTILPAAILIAPSLSRLPSFLRRCIAASLHSCIPAVLPVVPFLDPSVPRVRVGVVHASGHSFRRRPCCLLFRGRGSVGSVGRSFPGYASGWTFLLEVGFLLILRSFLSMLASKCYFLMGILSFVLRSFFLLDT